MADITYDRFDFGLDVRKGKSVSDANRMRVLRNAHPTPGRLLKKRACLSLIAILETGTTGLKGAQGKLNTFYPHGTAVTHANTLFQPNRVAHPTQSDANGLLAKIHYCDSFQNALYVAVEYANGNIRHHYLSDPGAWAATTAYSLGAFRRPTTPNGFIYEVTTAGTSASAQPSWPTTVGNTVGDGTVTWTCRATNVKDANCPNTASVVKAAQKIFAISGNTVKFSATDNATDWTTASDAGFLAVGLQQKGSTTPECIGEYKKQLGVFFLDGIQVWNIDPNPTKMNLAQKVEGVGSQYGKAVKLVGGDLFFLTNYGFKSLTVAEFQDNLRDVDIGSPIDSLIRDELSDSDDPIAVFFQSEGQYIAIFPTKAWTFTFSRSGKLAAWAEFTFPFSVDDATELNALVYVRQGNNVYQLDTDTFKDGDSSIPLVEIEMPFLDMKLPGKLKQFVGFDFVGKGTASIKFRLDAKDERIVTDTLSVTGDTRQGEMNPLVAEAVAIAPIINHKADEEFELHALTFYFEDLGPA